MSRRISVGVCQVSGKPYAADANRAAGVAAAEEAFERGADVAVLPELLVPGYVADRERLLPLAEPIDGPTVTAWRAVAA
ncbi:MAG: nitrilase-related carbon-nitrogen hydrolase, partial [Solirubrobacteraceae bacterium]